MTSPSEVTCPACQAPPASPCNVPTDRSRRGVPWYHNAREDLAAETDRAASDEAPHQMTLAEAIPFWDDWNPGIEHDLAALRAGRDLPGKSVVICERHGGEWGDDETCNNCTDEAGIPRVPAGVNHDLGPGAVVVVPRDLFEHDLNEAPPVLTETYYAAESRGRDLLAKLGLGDALTADDQDDINRVLHLVTVGLLGEAAVDLISAEQAREWAGYDVDLDRLAEAIPNSSIPEAIGVIASSLNEGA